MVGGLLPVAGVAMMGQATYGWLPSFDPPGWLRIVVIWMFPIGVIASAILGVLSAGRTLAIIGLALSVLSFAAFIAMLASSG